MNFAPAVARKENVVVGLLCLLAALRVFIYSAAFPFFNNVDELTHFDLVVRYSHGEWPRGLVFCSPEAARYIAAYNSPEYFQAPGQFPGGKVPPPLWKQPFAKVQDYLLNRTASLESGVNHESSEPPVYYTVAGLWFRLGENCGLSEICLLYWIRFLNIGIVVALVWLGFVAARQVFPGQLFPRLAVPALLAFIPQDAFYSIQDDVLSPLAFGLAFVGVIGWLRAQTPGLPLAVGTGLALAAAGLVKTANLPLVVITLVVLLLDLRRRAQAGQLRQALPVFLLFLFFSALPLLVWFAGNQQATGDFMGTGTKIKLLGWTRKPMANWWSHPIFTPGGFGTFWSELMASLWRGEIVWFGQRLALPVADVFYWFSSALLPGVSLIWLVRHFKNRTASERVLWFGLGSVLAVMAALVYLSVSFDFGSCAYPSRAYPYFTSGRLLGGALIPFLLLYAHGLDLLLQRVKNVWLKFGVLAAIVAFVTISEIIISAPVFASEYNLFHL